MEDRFDDLVRTREGRKIISDRFYLFHENWLIEEGITDYCKFLDEVEEMMPLTKTALNNLWERVLIATPEFIKGVVGWEEFKGLIQDWAVKSYDTNQIIKKAKHG